MVWPTLGSRTAKEQEQEHDGGTGLPTSPQTPGIGNPQARCRYATGQSADISVLFLVPSTGRLKWPHLHCRANAGTEVVKQTSNRLIASVERQVTNSPAHNRSTVGWSLVSILGSREILFREMRKKIETQDSRVLLTSLQANTFSNESYKIYLIS